MVKPVDLTALLRDATSKFNQLESGLMRLGFKIEETVPITISPKRTDHPGKVFKKSYEGAPTIYMLLGQPFIVNDANLPGGTDNIVYNCDLFPYLDYRVYPPPGKEPLLEGMLHQIGFDLVSTEFNLKGQRIIVTSLHPPTGPPDQIHDNYYMYMRSQVDGILEAIRRLDGALMGYGDIKRGVEVFKHP